MPREKRDHSVDFSEEARLFPLPNLVFFPHNVQPLHIFESRYREMMKDAIEGDQLITLATLEPGYEVDYYSRPPLAPVACAGRITHYEQNEDGTYHLLLVGMHRVRIGEEITPVRSFRRAKIAVLKEKPVPDHSEAGQQLADGLERALPVMKPLTAEFRKGKLTISSLTDIVAFHLPLPLPVKLELLAETDALRRATLLLDKLPTSSPKSTPPSNRRTFPPTFGLN